MRLWRTLGTTWLLEQWGAWARVPEDVRLGYPNKANFAKYMGGSIKTPEIDLDMALAVDRIIKISALINPQYETVIVRRFVHKNTQIQLARILHTNRREAVEILHRAEAWVDGYLHSVAHNLNLVGQVEIPETLDETGTDDAA